MYDYRTGLRKEGQINENQWKSFGKMGEFSCRACFWTLHGLDGSSSFSQENADNCLQGLGLYLK